MLNEVKRADIRRRVMEAAIKKGVDLKTKISFEIARRENTVDGLEEQIANERDEIVYLLGLDPIELELELESEKEATNDRR